MIRALPVRWNLLLATVQVNPTASAWVVPLLVVLAGLVIGGCPQAARAATGEPLTVEAINETARAVLDQPPFRVRETKRAIAWKNSLASPDWKPDASWDWLGDWTRGIARGLELAAWVLAAAGLAWAARQAWGTAKTWRGFERRSDRAPLSPRESLLPAQWPLPAQPGRAARSLLDAGDLRGAVAVLYRATVFCLDSRGLTVGRGATEAEVLRIARRELSAEPARLVEALVRAWLQIAYAHRQAPKAELARLCREWERHFAAPGPDDAGGSVGQRVGAR